jgi:hypothetical protein
MPPAAIAIAPLRDLPRRRFATESPRKVEVLDDILKPSAGRLFN